MSTITLDHSNLSSVITSKRDESPSKDIKSTERFKIQQFYTQPDNSSTIFKAKEDAYLSKIEQDLREEFEFYIKVASISWLRLEEKQSELFRWKFNAEIE